MTSRPLLIQLICRGQSPTNKRHKDMSHLAYSNLARLEGFEERGLNYTGIILDGWDSPSLLVHPLLLLFVWLTVGLPRAGKRGWQAWWCLFNVVIIHPMDQSVEGGGGGGVHTCT